MKSLLLAGLKKPKSPQGSSFDDFFKKKTPSQ